MMNSPGYALIAKRVMMSWWILAMITDVFNAINVSVPNRSRQITGVTGGSSVIIVVTVVSKGSTPIRKIDQ